MHSQECHFAGKINFLRTHDIPVQQGKAIVDAQVSSVAGKTESELPFRNDFQFSASSVSFETVLILRTVAAAAPSGSFSLDRPIPSG
jgi:hypothetical protein